MGRPYKILENMNHQYDSVAIPVGFKSLIKYIEMHYNVNIAWSDTFLLKGFTGLVEIVPPFA